MADPRAILARNLEASIAAKQALLAAADRIEAFARAVEAVVGRYQAGKTGRRRRIDLREVLNVIRYLARTG